MSRLKSIWVKLRSTSLFNVFGLAIGITASVVILLFVKYEQSYDSHNTNFNDIYRVRTILERPGVETYDGVVTPPVFARTVKRECPEIKDIVRFFKQGEMVFTINDRQFEEDKVCYVDSSVFKVFTLPLIYGDENTCLTHPNTAVISASTANKYFGNINPVGKMMNLQKIPVTITGVFQDLPGNSHFKFNVLLSYYTPNWLNKNFETAWDNFFLQTYFTVTKHTDIKVLEKKITDIYMKNLSANNSDQKRTAILQALKDIHLYSNYRGEFEQNGSGKVNVILTVVAFLILIIA
jgi:putative ABC transport system permease protein